MSSALQDFTRFARNSQQFAPIGPNWPESVCTPVTEGIDWPGLARNPPEICPKFGPIAGHLRPDSGPFGRIRANWPGFAPIRPNRPKSVGGARSQGGLVAFCGGATRPRMAKLFWRARTAPAPPYVAPPGCVCQGSHQISKCLLCVEPPYPVVAFPGNSGDLQFHTWRWT